MKLFFEILIYLLFGYALYEYRKEWGYIFILLGFGFIIEMLGVYFNVYRYSDYLIMLFGFPLAVPCAWAILLFGVYKIVSKSKVPPIFYPLLFGFYMLIVDIAMDPIMTAAGMWEWVKGVYPSTDWFSVPIYNFWAWFLAGGVVGIGYIYLSSSKKPSSTAYVIWGVFHPILWVGFMYILKFLPYLVLYYLLWGMLLFIGFIVSFYGFTKEVVPLDILMVRWSFYWITLGVFVFYKLYASKPYLIVPLVLIVLIEIFGLKMYDTL